MSKRVSNKRGKGGARSKVRLGWRKRRAREQLLRTKMKQKGGMLATLRRLFKRD